MRKPCTDPRIDAWHSRGAGAPPGLGGDVPPHLQGELLPKQRLLRPQPCLSASETPWPAPFPSATLPPASATASFPPFNLNKTELFFFFPWLELAGVATSLLWGPSAPMTPHLLTGQIIITEPFFFFPSTWLELGSAHGEPIVPSL